MREGKRYKNHQLTAPRIGGGNQGLYINTTRMPPNTRAIRAKTVPGTDDDSEGANDE